MNKRILLVLPIIQSTVLRGLSRALISLGWEVLIFDYRALSYSEKLINIAGYEKLAYSKMNKRLEKFIFQHKPSVMFVVKGEKLEPESLHRISRLGCLTINWFADDIQLYEMAKEMCSHYDLFCHFDSFALKNLKSETRNKNFYHFRFAADIVKGDKEPSTGSRPYNLSLVGNYYQKRETILPIVADLGLNIWGDSRWDKTSLANNYHHFIPFERVNEILQKSKIGINIQYDSPCWSLTNRPYEVATAGAMLLNEARPELDETFSIGKGVVAFENKDDLRLQAQYYLAHDAERSKIAKTAYQKISKSHTYFNRFNDLFRYLKT